jgi:hypothetical protein
MNLSFRAIIPSHSRLSNNVPKNRKLNYLSLFFSQLCREEFLKLNYSLFNVFFRNSQNFIIAAAHRASESPEMIKTIS